MIQFFKNLFKRKKIFSVRENTHNPEDFALRCVESWFSDHYYYIEYTANNGESWKRISGVTEPCWDYRYLREREIEHYDLCFNATKESIDEYRKRFPDYDSVLKFEIKEQSKCFSYERKRRELLRKYEEDIKKNTK